MTNPLIDLRDVRKIFQAGESEVAILKGISLSIQRGEFVAIMGQSGSGKSTLLNLIGCLDRATSGDYLIDCESVQDLGPGQLAVLRRHTFGFIFQRYNLISGLSAVQNVEIPSIYAGTGHQERIARASALLTSLGLRDRLHYKPSQLSGGQQQRVSIARALMNGGRVILADEPTGALDSKSGAEVMNILHDLHAKGHTVIMVTHDAGLASHAERIIRLADGEVVEDRTQTGEACLRRVESEQPEDSRLTTWHTNVREALKMALGSLRVNRFRTFLTMLGIIIGVGSVVAMLAIGDGAKQEVMNRIQAMGTNLLVVRPGAPGVRGTGGTITSLVP
ncbi:MAG: ATP-binding cassette domain-containing protein, partial [Syntrophales bacterium]|nr:ATP-binding cassette domain-containing protein [Syntrophales bacterium]